MHATVTRHVPLAERKATHSPIATLRLWLARYQARRELSALLGRGEDGLRDVGLSRTEIQNEMAKPFWDA